jgi:ribosomal protein S18 acetylase RimI-like enzyme
MGLTYFKRFRMEIDLRGRRLVDFALPAQFQLVPWNAGLVEAHAEAKFHSFRDEIDSNVFPCLGEYAGCLRLMEEIVRKPGFLPAATWLVADTTRGVESFCGTVQGVADKTGMGAIQNLGIAPEFRGRGLGTALMIKALRGFQQSGLPRAFLEVTAQNSGAVRLYKRLGFTRTRTVYKVSEIAYA